MACALVGVYFGGVGSWLWRIGTGFNFGEQLADVFRLALIGQHDAIPKRLSGSFSSGVRDGVIDGWECPF